jgi:hypothetical protein
VGSAEDQRSASGIGKRSQQIKEAGLLAMWGYEITSGSMTG